MHVISSGIPSKAICANPHSCCLAVFTTTDYSICIFLQQQYIQSCISTQLPSRRRSIQFHYAASECKALKCPKVGVVEGRDSGMYFDCDPECQEQKYYFYKKGESLICGQDFGEEYI